MALSTCIKCGGHTFEIQPAELSDSSYKAMFVQCSNCGGVVGVLDSREANLGTLDKPNTNFESGSLGHFNLNRDTYQLHVGTSVIQLTSTETRLLAYFIDNPNRAIAYNTLLEAIWEYPPNTGDPALVDAHVRNLNAKLSRAEIDEKQQVRKIHGVGWMFSI